MGSNDALAVAAALALDAAKTITNVYRRSRKSCLGADVFHMGADGGGNGSGKR